MQVLKRIGTIARLFCFAVLAGTLTLVPAGSLMAQETTTKVIPAAKKTQDLLKTKISVDFEDTILKEAVQELKDQVKGLVILIDTKGGVSQNGKLTFKAKDAPVSEVLEGMFTKNGLGYVIINNAKDAYPGAILIKQGKDRGKLVNSR